MKFQSKAHQLKAELDQLKPLDPDVLQRVNSKLKLDWTYHSNKIEGNSLTFGETKSLLLHNITAQGKPLRDHLEITQHNEAIEYILDIVKGDEQSRPLTEQFIKELHKILLKESYYSPAKSLDGTPTRKKIEVGQYKSTENHVETSTGEIFYFASVAETPARMNDLLDWYRQEIEKDEIDPIILAALFHYRFVRIHPFDDGNGRMARVLMNFILMKFGFPPAVITHEDRQRYYQVLQMADGDNLQPFVEFIEERVCNSLELMIKAAKGESIETLNDLDKKISILDHKLNVVGNKVKLKYSEENYSKWVAKNIVGLLEEMKERVIRVGENYNNLALRFLTGADYESHSDGEVEVSNEVYKIFDINKLNETESYLLQYKSFDILYDVFSRKNVPPFSYREYFTFEPKDDYIEFRCYGNGILIYEKGFLYDENMNENKKMDIVIKQINVHLEFIHSKI